MKLDKEDISRLQVNCTTYWWNHGVKTISFQGTLEKALKANDINITKKPSKENGLFIYTCKVKIGSNDVTIKKEMSGLFIVDFALHCIQYTMMYLGDKSQLTCQSRTFTINF